MREACLEVAAGAASHRLSPRAGSCLSDVTHSEGPSPAPTPSVRAALSRPPTRRAVTLPCLEAQLRVGHLTVAHGRVQDPRHAHKQAIAGRQRPPAEVHTMLQVRARSTACHRRRDPHRCAANDLNVALHLPGLRPHSTSKPTAPASATRLTAAAPPTAPRVHGGCRAVAVRPPQPLLSVAAVHTQAPTTAWAWCWRAGVAEPC